MVTASPAELPEPASALEAVSSATKEFSRDEKTGALNVTFEDLDLKSMLNDRSMAEDDVKRLPDSLKMLQGKRIKICGHMVPTFDETGIDQFVLDRSAHITNFGADPIIYELIQVRLAEGTTIDSIRYNQAIDVIGVFELEPLTQDGKMFGLYSLNDAEVTGAKTKRIEK